nr:hypothetical protein [Pseudobdellovibrionaceae bacterium]
MKNKLFLVLVAGLSAFSSAEASESLSDDKAYTAFSLHEKNTPEISFYSSKDESQKPIAIAVYPPVEEEVVYGTSRSLVIQFDETDRDWGSLKIKNEKAYFPFGESRVTPPINAVKNKRRKDQERLVEEEKFLKTLSSIEKRLALKDGAKCLVPFLEDVMGLHSDEVPKKFDCRTGGVMRDVVYGWEYAKCAFRPAEGDAGPEGGRSEDTDGGELPPRSFVSVLSSCVSMLQYT